jgi:hypothetical protein
MSDGRETFMNIIDEKQQNMVTISQSIPSSSNTKNENQFKLFQSD